MGTINEARIKRINYIATVSVSWWGAMATRIFPATALVTGNVASGCPWVLKLFWEWVNLDVAMVPRIDGWCKLMLLLLASFGVVKMLKVQSHQSMAGRNLVNQKVDTKMTPCPEKDTLVSKSKPQPLWVCAMESLDSCSTQYLWCYHKSQSMQWESQYWLLKHDSTLRL